MLMVRKNWIKSTTHSSSSSRIKNGVFSVDLSTPCYVIDGSGGNTLMCTTRAWWGYHCGHNTFIEVPLKKHRHTHKHGIVTQEILGFCPYFGKITAICPYFEII